jgi:DNA-binding NarL/FixJ family response regulator
MPHVAYVISSFSVCSRFTPREAIETAQTGVAARDALARTQYEVMVLDILLPLRAEDDPVPETSLALLRDLAEARGLLHPDHIVGLSAVQTLPLDVVNAFREHT